MPLSGARHACRCVGGRRKGRGGSRGEEWALVSHSWRPGRAGRLQVAAQAGRRTRQVLLPLLPVLSAGRRNPAAPEPSPADCQEWPDPPRVRHPLPGSGPLLLLLRVVALRRSESSPAPSSPPGADSEGAFLAPTGLPAPPPPLPLLPVTAEARSLARSLLRGVGRSGRLPLPCAAVDPSACLSGAAIAGPPLRPSVRPSPSGSVSAADRAGRGQRAAGGGLSSLPLAAAGPRPGHLRWAATKAPSGRGGPGHGVQSRQGGVVPRGGLS